MNANGGFIEVQGTAEDSFYTRAQLDEMLKMGEAGIKKLFEMQRQALEKLK